MILLYMYLFILFNTQIVLVFGNLVFVPYLIFTNFIVLYAYLLFVDFPIKLYENLMAFLLQKSIFL